MSSHRVRVRVRGRVRVRVRVSVRVRVRVRVRVSAARHHLGLRLPCHVGAVSGTHYPVRGSRNHEGVYPYLVRGRPGHGGVATAGERHRRPR